MVAPAIALLGRAIVSAASSYATKKVIEKGVSAAFERTLSGIDDKVKEVSPSAYTMGRDLGARARQWGEVINNNFDRTLNSLDERAKSASPVAYMKGYELGAKARRFGEIVSDKATEITQSDKVRDLVASGNAFLGRYTGAPLSDLQNRAVTAIAHRINAELSEPGSRQRQAGITSMGMSLGALGATIDHHKIALTEKEVAQFKAIGATLSSPLSIKASDQILDKQLLAQATELAARMRDGTAQQFIAMKPGANATAGKEVQQQQYERMTA